MMNEQGNDLVIAFDPGRDKTGYALTDLTGQLIWSGIFETGELESFIGGLTQGRIENVIEKNSELIPLGLLEREDFYHTERNIEFPQSNLQRHEKVSMIDRENLATNPDDMPEHEKKSVIDGKNIFSFVKFIAIGDGTTSKKFAEFIRKKINVDIIIVNEKNTTLEARNLYWKIHKPSLWMKFIPKGLRVPARVLDDLAAWAIALRAVKKYRDIRANKL